MTKEAVAVVIYNDKKEVLLLQRGPASRSEFGKWENLGGELLSGEDAISGLKREAKEELGINLDVKGKVFTTGDSRQEWRVDLYYGTTTDIPQIQEQDKCAGLKWVLLVDIFNQDLASFTRADFDRINREYLLAFL